MDYGNPITRAGWLDLFPRQKNRCVTAVQHRILNSFGKLAGKGAMDRVFARIARRVVGAYLYSLKIEVNTACEQHCSMCYLREQGPELSLDAIQGLYRQIRRAGVRVEILGGEPLLRKDIGRIVAGAKREARSPFVSLYTSATLADADAAAGLKRAGLDAAIVSLLSPRREAHDRLVGREGALARAVRGIGRLRAAGIAVYTFTPVHAGNIDDIEKIRDMAMEELDAKPIFYQYIPQSPDDPLRIPNESWRLVKHWVLSEKNPRHRDFVGRFYMLTGNACSGGNFVLTVKADGTVQPCPFVADAPLGSIHEEGIWAIYRRRFGNANYLEFKSLPDECGACSYRSVCGGGCRAAGRMLHGSYRRRDFRCLGPHAGGIDPAAVTDRAPSFF